MSDPFFSAWVRRTVLTGTRDLASEFPCTVSALKSTLVKNLVSVDPKAVTESPTLLESTLTKKGGEGAASMVRTGGMLDRIDREDT